MTRTFSVSTTPASTEQCVFLDHVFSTAVFRVRPNGYYDAGTEAKLIEVIYLLPSGQPCGLFSGIKDDREDEELSSFDEFDITWPDESI